MKTITTAIIGLGSRGYSLLKDVVLTMEDVKGDDSLEEVFLELEGE